MDESQEDINIVEDPSWFKPTYVLVAIDTEKSMFEINGAPSPFKNCIKAMTGLCDALILKSEKGGWSPFSILMYDKDEKADLVNFKDNMIGVNKLLKSKCSLTEEQLKNQYMRDYDVDLAAFFQLCKKKFKDVGSTFYRRTLIFITNDPDPVRGDPRQKFTALNEVKNFEENDIDFQLVTVNEDFDYSSFYDELFSLLNKKMVEIICTDEVGLSDRLSQTIWLRHLSRKMCFYPFSDDFSKYITVFKKSYLKPPKLLNNDWVAEDGTPVKRVLEDQEVLDVSLNEDVYALGSEGNHQFNEIEFDSSEKLEMKDKRFPVGYTLLYVCNPVTELGDLVVEPRIIEADSEEKLPFFNEFWKYCVNNKKVLMCAKVSSSNDDPGIVEFVPKFIGGNKVFLTKQVPSADEIFEPEFEPPKEVVLTDQQLEVTDSLIRDLSMDFSRSFLKDIDYLKKESYIKSKLLDEPRQEPQCEDVVTPEQIDAKLEDLMEAYMECFPPEQGKKRKSKNFE